MKYFLIGFAVYFAVAWLPQFARCWINGIRYKIGKKKAKPCDKWAYEIMDRGV
ncbi:MAG: hypothetical protein IIX02_04350 [Clostridia bacterium]|nr:hypothetical protein [Clostridia bacterium]